MIEKNWEFFSNHGLIFIYLAKNSNSTVQVIAQEIGLSIRAVQNIIHDLEESGYLTKQKIGRCNRYMINSGMPLPHRLNQDYTVADLLSVLGCKIPQ